MLLIFLIWKYKFKIFQEIQDSSVTCDDMDILIKDDAKVFHMARMSPGVTWIFSYYFVIAHGDAAPSGSLTQ